MYQIYHQDGFVILSFNYLDESDDCLNSSVEITIDYPLGLHPRQIKMLDDFFERIMSTYVGGIEIQIMVERLKSEEVSIVAYLFDDDKDYDFCGTFNSIFYALHTALSILFNLSINSLESYKSINADLPLFLTMASPNDIKLIKDLDPSHQPDDPENKPDVKSPPSSQTDLDALGKKINELLKNDDGPDKNEPKK